MDGDNPDLSIIDEYEKCLKQLGLKLEQFAYTKKTIAEATTSIETEVTSDLEDLCSILDDAENLQVARDKLVNEALQLKKVRDTLNDTTEKEKNSYNDISQKVKNLKAEMKRLEAEKKELDERLDGSKLPLVLRLMSSKAL